MRGLPPALLAIFLFLAGCSTPPLNVVPVATISNTASLDYAYDKGTPFRLQSAPADIVALAPCTASDITTATSKLDVKNISSTIERSDRKSLETATYAQSGTSLINETASQRDLLAESSLTEAAVKARNAAFITEASQVDTTEESVTKASLSHSGIEYQLTDAACVFSSANASTTCALQLPTIKKWAPCDRVVVGNAFKYIIEVYNGTPIDLVFAEVSDLFDTRLSITPSAIQTTPRAQIETDMEDRLLSIRFTHGIKRGQTIRIVIPALIKTDIATQAAE